MPLCEIVTRQQMSDILFCRYNDTNDTEMYISVTLNKVSIQATMIPYGNLAVLHSTVFLARIITQRCEQKYFSTLNM